MIVSLARRALLGALTFVLTTAVLYSAIRMLPGTPWADDPTTPRSRVEAWAAQHHLDRGLATGYLLWVRDTARGEMGTSYTVAAGADVSTLIRGAAPTSILLGALGLGLALSVAVGTGLASARRPGGMWDRAWSGLLYLLSAAPSFWIAIGLQDFFALRLGLLPSFGSGPIDALPRGAMASIATSIPYWILPPLCLALGSLAFLFRFTRASLLDSVASTFVRAGRARGLPARNLIGRHALADARIHLVTWLGLVVPSLIGGSIIIESVFGLPGLGRLFFHAVDARDYPVVMGVGFTMTVASVAGSTCADLLYQIVEPRLRARRETA